MLKRDSSKPAALLKVTLLHEFFSRFSNCTNGTKSRKASHKLILLNTSVYFLFSFNFIQLYQVSQKPCILSKDV